MEEFIKQIEALRQAGEAVSKLQAETTEQESALLDQVVQKLLPVMRFMDYPIKVHGYKSGDQFSKWGYDYHKDKGLLLVDLANRTSEDRSTRGCYRGHYLVLTRSGKFLRFDQDGEWSAWQGESSWFENKPTEISTKQAVETYGFSEIINGLATEFQEAVKKSEKKRAALEARMEQVKKIKELLS